MAAMLVRMGKGYGGYGQKEEVLDMNPGLSSSGLFCGSVCGFIGGLWLSISINVNVYLYMHLISVYIRNVPATDFIYVHLIICYVINLNHCTHNKLVPRAIFIVI